MAGAVGCRNEILVIALTEPVKVAAYYMLRPVIDKIVGKNPPDVVLRREQRRLYPAGIIEAVSQVLVPKLEL